MEGIIIVNKPQDWTSFDVVAKIRNLSKVKKVGHSGTLDPIATGVLPIFLGKATKSIEQFMLGDKGYIAEMTLGVATDTLDATGKVQKSAKVKSSLADIDAILKKYKGEQDQIPPMHSAVKVKGKKLYELARKGITVKRDPRRINIYRTELLNYEAGENPRVTFEVVCSKGTYVRQLIADMGDELGCGAHMSKLMRTLAQPFHITQAVNMDTIITLAKIGRLHSIVTPLEDIVGNLNPHPASSA
jgi:tRNA pseudouridine55 synthase